MVKEQGKKSWVSLDAIKGTRTVGNCYDWFSSLVRMEQRQFGGRRDLDYSIPRVWWLRTLLHGKAKAQGNKTEQA